jgi:polyribonucleotide nucleotidyltransferase
MRCARSTAEVGFLPRTHGSALFTRGETQGSGVTTLGTGDDEQIIDALTAPTKSRFMLHYNFPPYSVGERAVWAPGRREIGHGKLAWRALQAVLPAADRLPVHDPSRLRDHRVQRLVLHGHGLRLLAGDDGCGVPLKAPVAGIAMGLIWKMTAFASCPTSWATKTTSATWTSRSPAPKRRHLAPDGHQGRRHHQGDHGNRPGAGERRPHAHPRRDEQGAVGKPASCPSTPRDRDIKIPVDKIRDVIGSGGKVIREIVEESGAKVDINDDGVIKIAALTPTPSEGLRDDQLDRGRAGSRQDLQGQGRQASSISAPS